MDQGGAALAAEELAVVAGTVSTPYIDVGVDKIVWAVFRNVPTNLHVLDPIPSPYVFEHPCGLSVETRILGASHYLKATRGDEPVLMGMLACGPSIQKLDRAPQMQLDYEELVWRDGRDIPVVYEDDKDGIVYRDRISFRPPGARLPRRKATFEVAYGFGDHERRGRGLVVDLKGMKRRLRHDPLTVVRWRVEVREGRLGIRIWTEHEYKDVVVLSDGFIWMPLAA